MHHIVYVSTATVPVTERDLHAFLQRWCANNARDGITGVLLYAANAERFMQVIEGEEAPLRALFGQIERDSRHRDLVKLADGPVSARNFSTWLMGFRVLSTDAFAQLAGYVDPHSALFQQALAAPDALIRHLLEAFASDPAPHARP